MKSPGPDGKETLSLSPDQARAFLSAARGDRFEALYVVALHCDLQQCEMLGPRWEAVSPETGTLQVRQTLSEIRTGHRFEPSKNGKGRRVKLTAGAVNALKNHRKLQLEERMRHARAWRITGSSSRIRSGRP